MSISAMEFIRRFFLHVLPKNFTKIKHYGLLSNRGKKSLIKLCRILIGQVIFSDFIYFRKKIVRIHLPILWFKQILLFIFLSSALLNILFL